VVLLLIVALLPVVAAITVGVVRLWPHGDTAVPQSAATRDPPGTRYVTARTERVIRYTLTRSRALWR